MLVCTLDGDLYPPLEEPTGTTDSKNKKKDKDKDKKFVWNHGSKSLPLLYWNLVGSECGGDRLSVLEWLNLFNIQLHLSHSSYPSSEEHKEEAV